MTTRFRGLVVSVVGVQSFASAPGIATACCYAAEERSRNLDDTLKSVKPWVTFAGGVLVVAVLYWAQAVLVPFALAILLTFVLTPPVTWLQRWVGRVPAVLLVVTLVFAALGLAGWGLTWQMDRSGRRPARLSRQHPNEDCRRAPCGQGKRGREAAGHVGGHQG